MSMQKFCVKLRSVISSNRVGGICLGGMILNEVEHAGQ